MSIKLLTVLSLTLLVALSCALTGGRSAYQLPNPRYYCGRALARAVASLCYDDRPSEERAETGIMHNALLPPHQQEQANHLDGSWIPKARALGLPSRGQRFVVSECCYKACSVQELLSYCDRIPVHQQRRQWTRNTID